MFLQVFRHAEALNLLLPEDRLHGLVGSEPLLLLRILQVILLQVVPQLLHYLRPRHLLALCCADDFGQLIRHVEGLLDASLLRRTHLHDLSKQVQTLKVNERTF